MLVHRIYTNRRYLYREITVERRGLPALFERARFFDRVINGVSKIGTTIRISAITSIHAIPRRRIAVPIFVADFWRRGVSENTIWINAGFSSSPFHLLRIHIHILYTTQARVHAGHTYNETLSLHAVEERSVRARRSFISRKCPDCSRCSEFLM